MRPSYFSIVIFLLLITSTNASLSFTPITSTYTPTGTPTSNKYTPTATPTTNKYTPTATPTSKKYTPTSYPPVSKNSLAYQFMAPQNAARAAVRLPPLVWDSRLASYAQWWANQRRWDCALEHSNGPYGENIFWGSSSGFTPYQAASGWVAERNYYNYGYNSCAGGQECGHYTQIVWRTSKRIGCAQATCYYGQGVFMICSYDPPGNYIGQKPY